MKVKELTPNPLAMMESTRSIGYSTETAIADILDNSIAANAKNIDIFYSPAANKPYIAIVDDGCGMSSKELDIAMTYGGHSPLLPRQKEDLGRFGLGLKTASLSQCDKLLVVSKHNKRLNARCWDMGFVNQKRKWQVLVLDSNEINSLPEIDILKTYTNGTLVIWENLKRMQQGDECRTNFNDIMDNVRQHIALVFHRFLSSNDKKKNIVIRMNNNPIEPSDPFLKSKSSISIPPYIIPNTKVKVTPYQLPHKSRMKKNDYRTLGITDDLLKNQGLYIYRNNRLIIWGTWFRRIKKTTFSQLARIQVDIPSDYDSEWILDVKKSTVTPPPLVIKSLEELITRLAEFSKRTLTHRGKNETDPKITHVWNRKKNRNGGYFYEINSEHLLVKKITEQAPEIKQKLLSFLELISNSLPLNQIYVDLNSDDIEINDNIQISEEQIKNMINDMLLSIPEGTKNNFLKNLYGIEPFNKYSQILDSYLK